MSVNGECCWLTFIQKLMFVYSGPTILLMYNAGPVDLTWADASDKVVSILENFYPAQVPNILIYFPCMYVYL